MLFWTIKSHLREKDTSRAPFTYILCTRRCSTWSPSYSRFIMLSLSLHIRISISQSLHLPIRLFSNLFKSLGGYVLPRPILYVLHIHLSICLIYLSIFVVCSKGPGWWCPAWACSSTWSPRVPPSTTTMSSNYSSMHYILQTFCLILFKKAHIYLIFINEI